MDLFITDALAPFCRGLERRRVNWSKIPFSHLERNGLADPARFDVVRSDFETYCRRAAEAGFNAITLDDLAHLADSPRYPESVRDYIRSYQSAYRPLVDIATSFDLQIFVNTDVIFSHRDAPGVPGPNPDDVRNFLRELFENLFATFPAIRGSVFRIGESDGLDVEESFRSRLAIRSHAHARALLKTLLPVFERLDRLLVFRTWSVGAYRVGDLIWNRDSFRRVFDSIHSDHLIVSMKYGESDFFRYLPLNPQFFRSGHQKIIELQARREYEGSGAYPSFIGPDYARYRDELGRAAGMRGIMVWCQTGGWTRFQRLTYVEDSSVWNEINAWVTVRLFKYGESPDDAVASWCRDHGYAGQIPAVTELLRLSDEVVRELLYVDEFARKKIFFRRLRVPPLITVFWDHILVNHTLEKVLRCVVREPVRQIELARQALRKIRRMAHLAERARLPRGDIDFMYDTYEILAAARDYYFLPFQPVVADRLRRLTETYRARYPVRYSVNLNFKRAPFSSHVWRLIFLLMTRNKRGYRLVDRLFTLTVLSWLYPLFRRRPGVVPDFAHERAMGMDVVFK